MNIKYWNQPKTASLESILNDKLKRGFDKVIIVAGMAKDSGVDLIFDSIKYAKESGTDITFMMGIDRKNTSKDMLMKLLSLGCNLYVHINREESKVETRAYVFESNDSDSFVYLSSGKFSEGGLTSNQCLIQEICYSKEDKKLFENFKAMLLQGTENVFNSANENEIKLLAEKGEIVARITERKIPSISQMYGDAVFNSVGDDNVYDEGVGLGLFEIPQKDELDIEVDVDFGNLGSMKSVEFATESEAKKEAVSAENTEELAKFYGENDLDNDKKKIILKDNDEVKFDGANIFVFSLNKIVTSGVGKGEVKIPRYLAENLSYFFGFDTLESFSSKVSFSIEDVLEGKKIVDDDVEFYDTGKHFAIKSSMLNGLNPDENDIIRMIKNGDKNYTIELIRQGSAEYNIWESFCKNRMKNSKRTFGIM